MSTIRDITLDKNSIKNQLGENPDKFNLPINFKSDIKVEQLITKLVLRNISASMIWGSSQFGTWGDAKWGGAEAKSLVLNSATQGVLGNNLLGDSSLKEVLYAVLPKNNIYREYFDNPLYINETASTGTLNAPLETYSLQPGEVLESEVICKLRGPINKVQFLQYDGIVDTEDTMRLDILQLGISIFNDDNAEVQVSNDSGNTWVSIANLDDVVTFPSTSNLDELKYRVVASKAIDIQGPLIIKVN